MVKTIMNVIDHI